jgi:SAM-dependent methyltransferase
MNEAEWEAHFRELGAKDSPAPVADPDGFVERIAATLSPSRALDLACGSGRNALWLAREGWDVTAIDRSPSAIELVRRTAAAHGLKLTPRVYDLEAHKLSEKQEFTIEPAAWDLILMCRYLHRELWEPAKLGLAPGGVLVVTALLADPEGSGAQRFRVRPGELHEYFGGSEGWKIVDQHEDRHEDATVAAIAVRRGD